MNNYGLLKTNGACVYTHHTHVTYHWDFIHEEPTEEMGNTLCFQSLSDLSEPHL